jgi:hypothetical protein
MQREFCFIIYGLSPERRSPDPARSSFYPNTFVDPQIFISRAAAYVSPSSLNGERD